MKQQLSRRHFLYLSAATATTGLLAACTTVAPQGGQSEAGGSADAAPVELRLAEGSWIGPEGIAFWTDTIIPAFEEANPGIKVSFESAESPDYEDKLYTQAVAGDAPDVFFIWWSAGLMEEGQLLALDDYFDDEYMADFYEGNI
ncbi:MAG TPA: extracellular solute-binding protein, partial [Caldilineaceae bacterium]|nr:extracellular solute-binding protein [Caldilineaceae bacterium]